MPRPTVNKWSSGSDVPGGLGGRAVPLQAGVVNLLIGDSVWLSGALLVSKSAVTADHLKRVGIVIGGRAFFGETSQDPLDVGEVAAAALNDLVWVATHGVVYAKTDTTAILVGSPVAPSIITAGFVRLATVTTDLVAGDTGKIHGIALDANGGVNGTRIRVLLLPM